MRPPYPQPVNRTAILYDDSFNDGAALVVGGSGALGHAVCVGLAKAGSDIALTYNSNKKVAEEIAAEIRDLGRKAICLQLDLTQPDQAQKVVTAAETQLGKIHSLVYASGPYMDFGKIADIEPATWKRVIEADIGGYFNLLHAAIPALRRSQGSIVALTSAGTRRYPPGDILSAGAKASVELLTKAVAREEGRNGIRANCIGVGWIDAGLGRSVQDKPGVAAFVQRFMRGTPISRFGTKEEIAAVAVFLTSQAASYVSGNLICVDGAGSV